MKYLLVVIAAALLFFNCSVTHAQEDPVFMHPEVVVEGMATKLVRGTANIATSGIELPKQVYKTYRKSGLLKGVVIGPLKGLGMVVVRIFTGATEVGLFPIPVTGNYDPYFEPEYAWQGWTD